MGRYQGQFMEDILLGVTERAKGVELFGSESRSILKSECGGCDLHVVIR